MPLTRDLREFVELLNSNGVDYLVVGAFAVAWCDIQDLRRTSTFRPDSGNAAGMLEALRQFGLGSLGTSVGQVVQLGVKPKLCSSGEPH
jgi:hypothetical protein